MKKTGFILLVVLGISCATGQKTGLVAEDEMFITRKYIGTFVDYRQSEPQTFGGPHLIWIKTSMDSTFGKISAYGRKCDFAPGEKLYLRRTYYAPGVFGYWVYQIENDSSVFYRASEYQYDSKVLVQNWY
ncbi:MAG: hypothetical protein WCE64_16300 [Bacteroidales bacterium]